MVRTAISRRGPTACFIAPWWAGANRNPTPASSMQRATRSGGRSSRTPAASSTSALPERPETERLPCFATLAPAPAATRAPAVETLNVPRASPPVPQVSTRCVPSTSTRVARRRITAAAAAISSTVSPFMRSPTRKPPTCAGVHSPVMMACMTAVICAPSRSRRSMTPRIADWMSIVFRPRMEQSRPRPTRVGWRRRRYRVAEPRNDRTSDRPDAGLGARLCHRPACSAAAGVPKHSAASSSSESMTASGPASETSHPWL